MVCNTTCCLRPYITGYQLKRKLEAYNFLFQPVQLVRGGECERGNRPSIYLMPRFSKNSKNREAAKTFR